MSARDDRLGARLSLEIGVADRGEIGSDCRRRVRRARDRDDLGARPDEEDDPGVRDVVLLALMLVLLDVHAECAQQRLEALVRARHALERWVEARQIRADPLRRIAERIDADEYD